LNATLQCLKAIPELTALVKKYRGGDELTARLKEVFVQLDYTAAAVEPDAFVMLFRALFPHFAQRTERGMYYSGQDLPHSAEVNAGYMQQDAEEFYTTLLSSLAQHLGALQEGTANKNAIDQLFSGEMLTEYKCLEAVSEEAEVSPQFPLLFAISSRCHCLFFSLYSHQSAKRSTS
jgi:ubiquitin carboxyl-terminal hydrolase 14